MNDVRRDWLDRRVHDLIRTESQVESVLCSTPDVAPGPSTVGLSEFAALPTQHRDALVGYLGNRYPPESIPAGDAAEPVTQPIGEDGGDWMGVLPALFTTLAGAIIGYAALFEAALRLYDEELRAIAPRHQTDYSAAMYAVADLLAPAVAAELDSRGLGCHCVCPMCSLGVCGCIAVGRMAATSPLRPRTTEPDSDTGFLIQAPRPGSQFANLGVSAGDRLLAIDDQPVNNVPDIQAAIRKHEVGETIRLLIAHQHEQRELDALHAGDYHH